MSKKVILLTNIQRFSLHDGPGIRTTVFLKGCSLHCPWCSNPENISNHIQKYVKDGIEGIYGYYYTSESLYEEIIKDKPFYIGKVEDYHVTTSADIVHLPGGVTFSGGECLLQIEALIPLLMRLNSEHIHMAVETCLFVPQRDLKLAIKHIDFFYVDIKILSREECKKILHGDLELYFSNLDILLYSKKPVVFRIPVIGGYTNGEDNIKNVAHLIKKYVDDKRTNLLKIEIIKEHDLGKSKYWALKAGGNDIDIPRYQGVSDETMEQYKQEIIRIVGFTIPIEICKV